MPLLPYNKPALTYAQQIQQLQERGLTINNSARANHLLESISYYRLSGYWFPLLADKTNHLFKENSNFDTAFNLYCFDRELRVLVIRELEKIEVSIRAKMIYVLSHQYGAFWYQNPTLFKNHISHSKSLGSLEEEYNRSDEEFIKAFKKKYSDDLPPSWMLLELTSFGTLSFLFSNLQSNRTKRDIANYFGLSDTIFGSWMHSIVYLRNVCAHHSRLWNRVMSIQPNIPQSPKKTWLNNTAVPNNKSYFILSMILYLMQTINPKNTIAFRFAALLKKYPNVDVFAMGFPKDWEKENLWK
ncbi:Abi family protein [Flavobacterium gawalongense]|uniref:Abi family protein n=1 Tax=Flavobacterium gawalongense TaxID=2594432 RepID=A0A553BJ33_9FLAO|nr:Abi family protein [Flavobacterium gawalongense]TRX08266.1 Abi family protein [Flavobacterium gawalongense]TRX09054.1 Abi family protein [Flavobacterium gawalongense]TRX25254.1 Abi family protein [Flavobacterium gawalongense]